MALLIPKDRDFEEFNGSYGEHTLYQKFSELSDDYIIFHSVKWQNKQKNNVKNGEADFVILNKKRGILCLEVKHGGIKGSNGRIKQINRKTSEENFIDPMNQSNSSKYKLIDIVNDIGRKNKCKIIIEPMVWFTGISTKDIEGEFPDLEYKINHNTFFNNHLSDIDTVLNKCFDYYNMNINNINKNAIDQIVLNIAPEFSAFASMSNLINNNEYYFNRMTHEQSYLLDYLSEQNTAVIQGGAGTGKTMLAVEKAKRLSENENVLFLCFNSLLVQFLRNRYSDELPGVTFTNLYSLAARALKKTDILDIDIIEFLDNIESYNKIWEFDSIIIDEAQDFNDEFIIMLKEIAMINEVSFYIFYDKNQLVQNRDNLTWLKDMECRLVLNLNCRNTMKIAETSSNPIGIDKVKMKIPIEGDYPLYHNVNDRVELLTWLEKRIRYYTDNGINKNQITILTSKTLDNSLLARVNKIGNYTLSQDINTKDILFTTARKFKGLESDVILFIDIDEEQFKNDEQKRVFYVGASRAKSQLELITVLNADEQKKMFLKISKGKSSRKGVLLTDLKVKII
ncbi:MULTISPECIES: nuclease-related domain-containing DEAD/DEAH box helicase [Mammaliicoccus]|uniref:nuclease-related domain-containing DEAD/DEAH box helicase n=1 Tax=Mammaliicoccus TaxID=2803850 RepID=UPI001C4E6162|nr:MULTISPECIES: NERD domain-containing protein [Mammaliicoccus]MBW0764000.1 AAA family ATPase [Mammaliicoccus fleurettii]MEB7806043.1 NERD domain-containing protein [Mammaliicoccus fleurettii]